jgi:hypothetical protein
VEPFQILVFESIPKMLGLKKLELNEPDRRVNQQFCIEDHIEEIEELKLSYT